MMSKEILQVLHNYNVSYIAGATAIICHEIGDDQDDDRTAAIYAVLQDVIDMGVGTANLAPVGTSEHSEAKQKFLKMAAEMENELRAKKRSAKMSRS